MVWCNLRSERGGLLCAALSGCVRGSVVGTPQVVDEAGDAANVFAEPGPAAIPAEGEHHVAAYGVGTVLLDKFVGGDDVATTLAHFPAVFAQHDALIVEAGHRFGEGGSHVGTVGQFDFIEEAGVSHCSGEEASVEQVHSGVFDAAGVLVNGQPVSGFLRVNGVLVVVGTQVAVLVP